jgi:hypothetical protein
MISLDTAAEFTAYRNTTLFLITADPGHAPADKPHGNQTRTRRSKEGMYEKEFQVIFQV